MCLRFRQFCEGTKLSGAMLHRVPQVKIKHSFMYLCVKKILIHLSRNIYFFVVKIKHNIHLFANKVYVLVWKENIILFVRKCIFFCGKIKHSITFIYLQIRYMCLCVKKILIQEIYIFLWWILNITFIYLQIRCMFLCEKKISIYLSGNIYFFVVKLNRTFIYLQIRYMYLCVKKIFIYLLIHIYLFVNKYAKFCSYPLTFEKASNAQNWRGKN